MTQEQTDVFQTLANQLGDMSVTYTPPVVPAPQPEPVTVTFVKQ
jgi:hypothetical protein